ncbi:peptidase M20 family protein (homolog to succinyl-diaminopimelate desuccinylase) (plasmid) [Natrialba magadii ATCC 43099]|uniref:Acetylornithine deacetylase/succinyl-diaminopimelate desuccinylase n=1 Tax=Natrialba magadii (strain ATCC 43099 / DSM 3394 / CCM 3739 / CIP 104546 / IAM 13178 / JCM 8861 / NBRC 102185 / NCIMB 2190 / MS3) TaxID=547559 RepID=D3T136_NATMM|nr:M20 family metallopeptidase [Natrialba magadii]ADD07295.1 peptidase M20 family protein (homolog to succinyl-diaminopimelate desuccinylase) [Natrialba magadii ATCC 43099]ELY32723.1 acetylornithine deacetylase/succinyl-diaminopimelate desuccinylase [Natrialba magadii ATCC 43099]
MSQDRRENVESLVADLVAIETENPPGNEQACAEYIVDWFADRGIEAELVEEPYADRPQVGVKVGDGDPALVLNGHIDVVPAGDTDHWSTDPYVPTVVDDSLYGRGSVDMKTGVAIGMLATAQLADEIEAGELDGSVVFHAAIGEETAEPGTKTLLDRGYDGDYGVVLEPTAMQTGTSEKGLAWYEIRVNGDPSHASRPDQGTNAIRNAQPVLDALNEYDATVREREDDLVGQAYSTVTMIEAGTKENVVPEEAVITIDRRFLPDETIEEIDAEIEDVLETVSEAHDIETTWERTRTYESAAIETDSHLASVFRKHSKAVADVPTDDWGVSASTDVRNFINDHGIEAITWGPGDLTQAHTYDEHVSLPAAVDGLEALLAGARELLDEE